MQEVLKSEDKPQSTGDEEDGADEVGHFFCGASSNNE
jgi:hypothetical protein